MIFIVSALYPELEPFIEKYSLSISSEAGMKLYKNDQIVAAIMGTGKVNAAYSLGKLFSLYPPCEDSVLINVGIAAGSIPGSTFVINSITDQDSDRRFYPDMLYNIGLQEKGLVTSSKVITELSNEDALYDMEASAVYMCGMKCISPDRMFFIKTVSDSGVSEDMKFTAEFVKELVSNQIPYVDRIIDIFKKDTIAQESSVETIIPPQIYSRIHLTNYLENELVQLIRFANSMNLDGVGMLEDIITGFENLGLPEDTNGKKLSREVLDEFKRRLIK